MSVLSRHTHKLFRFLLRPAAALALPALLLNLAAQPAGAQVQVTVYSQNGEHFSGNKPKRLMQKCAAFAKGMHRADVVLLQEVQGKNVESDMQRCLGWAHARDKQAIIRGRYGNNEYYAILYNKTLKVKKTVEFAKHTSTDFSRPPLAVLFEKRGKEFWVTDFHAIFGKTERVREKEARKMRDVVYKTLHKMKPGTPIIIGGDWNLETSDSTAFSHSTFAKPADTSHVCASPSNPSTLIYPNVKTTLNARSYKTVSAYDHFAFNRNEFSSCRFSVYDGGYAHSQWRRSVSDHLGIIGSFVLR